MHLLSIFPRVSEDYPLSHPLLRGGGVPQAPQVLPHAGDLGGGAERRGQVATAATRRGGAQLVGSRPEEVVV